MTSNSDNLDSFEYDVNKDTNSKAIEKTYETVYLYSLKNNFLYKLRYPQVPKSLIREFADQTGLTEFIMQETKLKESINHSELAAQYFGSEELWKDKINQFLINKSNCLVPKFKGIIISKLRETNFR